MSYMGPDQNQGNLPPNSVPAGVLQDGSVGFSNLNAATQALVLMSAGTRNILRNGAFGLDFGGRAAATAAKSYFTEGWYIQQNAPGQAQGSYLATAGNGIEFTFIGRLAALAANALTAGSFWCIGQNIEGYELRRLMWGTPKAKPATLSFMARASITGTYSVSIRNADATRSFVSTFTLASGIWQKVTIAVPPVTDGVWDSGGGLGAQLWFVAGCGSTYQTATLNAWQNVNMLAGVNQTQLPTVNAAVFDLTGVQLEQGTSATDFEYIPFGLESIRSARYYWPIFWKPTGVTYTPNSDTRTPVVMFPVPMRATPTVVGAPGNLNVIGFGNAGDFLNVDIGAPGLSVDSRGFHQNGVGNPAPMAAAGSVAYWGSANAYTLYMDAQL